MTQSRDAHYAHLNNRFDARARVLRALGFRYEHIEGYDAAAFVKPRPDLRKVPHTIQAAYVMHADDICWADTLAELVNDARDRLMAGV